VICQTDLERVRRDAGFVRELQVLQTLTDFRRDVLAVRDDTKLRRDRINSKAGKNESMKNIQIIDSALNSVYDIFAATDQEFALIFPGDQDIAFIDEVMARGPAQDLEDAFERIWQRRIPKREAVGIHALLFYHFEEKKQFYPTRKDEEARNPDGTKLR
jgi:hypothetical protein